MLRLRRQAASGFVGAYGNPSRQGQEWVLGSMGHGLQPGHDAAWWLCVQGVWGCSAFLQLSPPGLGAKRSTEAGQEGTQKHQNTANRDKNRSQAAVCIGPQLTDGTWRGDHWGCLRTSIKAGRPLQHFLGVWGTSLPWSSAFGFYVCYFFLFTISSWWILSFG